jgi:hypothetical protein
LRRAAELTTGSVGAGKSTTGDFRDGSEGQRHVNTRLPDSSVFHSHEEAVELIGDVLDASAGHG